MPFRDPVASYFFLPESQKPPSSAPSTPHPYPSRSREQTASPGGISWYLFRLLLSIGATAGCLIAGFRAMADHSQQVGADASEPPSRAAAPVLPPQSSASATRSPQPLPPAAAAAAAMMPPPPAAPSPAPAGVLPLPPQAPIDVFNNGGAGVAAAGGLGRNHQLYSPSGRKRKQRTSGVWRYFEQFTPSAPKGRNVRCTILVDAPPDPALGLPQRQVT